MGDEVVVGEARSGTSIAYGRTTYATPTPSAKNKSANGIHGRTVLRSAGVRPGATNAQIWYRMTGIARMIPMTIEIRSWIDERVAGPEDLNGRLVARAAGR